MPPPAAVAPPARLSRAQALDVVASHLGGFDESTDRLLDPGSLRLLPVTTAAEASGAAHEFGAGLELVRVWQFVLRRAGTPGTYRARVDAASGELFEFLDVNQYVAAQVTGGVYQGDRPAPSVILPMPFANVSIGGFTNSAGVYDWPGGAVSSTLNGQFVRSLDSCGAISQGSGAGGAIAFGTSGGTDCTTPGSGGAGNTHASRTQFYHLNRAKEAARGWLPTNAWLNAQLTANVNLNQTCNAYWNGSTVNFFRSGGGCANTGELPGVSMHEYGHGLDSNDGFGSSPENGTGETYGDFTAALATHDSCVGNGFLGGNCGGYGDPCTSCSGVRDIDWALHVSNAPHTVANFTQPDCPSPMF